MRFLITTIILFLLSIVNGYAQRLTHVQGEIMVSLDIDSQPYFLDREISYIDGKQVQPTYEQVCATPINVWLVKFDHNYINANYLLDKIKEVPQVRHAQRNHITELRAEPNDPRYPQQWQYRNLGSNGGVVDADLDMEEAWDITTGGLTAEGDTIVVCIIDNGLDPDHNDIQKNVWKNYDEIPNNGIDDDNNGYIDDHLGWNVDQNNDNIYIGGTHGTPVTGIIGADGNNDLGVTGVNWNIKMMIIRRGGATETAAIAAFAYAHTLRKTYNETDGARGAYVVATNGSWGASGFFEADAPLWCDFYNKLGEVGILSMGATTNSESNVEEVGDLPTTCTSDYLISVTNVDRRGERHVPSGYGSQSIDLASFGEDVYTTTIGSNYGNFGGTSGATPHVAGVAALIYSIDCGALVQESKINPAGAALAVRDYLLLGVDLDESLNNITVTGGRLNAKNSLDLAMNACSDCPFPIGVTVSESSPSSITVNWSNIDAASSYNIRFKQTQENDWTEVQNISSPHVIDELMFCEDYEVQLLTNCNGSSSGWSNSRSISSGGCCVLPSEITFTSEGNNINLEWDEVQYSSDFIVSYRLQSSDQWVNALSNEINYTIEGEGPCLTYEVKLRTRCSEFGTQSEESEIYLITTECGSCTSDLYCDFGTKDNGGEWIASVELGDLSNQSESDPEGYGDYLGVASAKLRRSQSYNITLTPNFSGTTYDEYFTVWIDWNQDGEFEEVSERAFDAGEGSNVAVVGNIQIPSDAVLGNTRMRVIMAYIDNVTEAFNDSGCDPGTSFRFGEVEDYCVDILPMETSTDDLDDDLSINLLSNPVSDFLTLEFTSKNTQNYSASIFGMNGQILYRQPLYNNGYGSTQTMPTSNLTEGVYILHITDGKTSKSVKFVKM